MSVKNVQAYMPYERGIYGGAELSADAVRADRYRNRMKKAASMQVVKRTKGEVNLSKVEEKTEMTKEMEDKKGAESKESYTGGADVLRLHLELDLKYGVKSASESQQQFNINMISSVNSSRNCANRLRG